jgi:predicted RNA methylase
MTGFSTDWLALREPADRAARNPQLLDCVATFISAAKSLTILDLGAGTGSTLRAVAPVLRTAQRWVLVDVDGSLVSAGAHLLAAWAAESLSAGDDFQNAVRDLNRDHDLPGQVPRTAAAAPVDAAANAPPLGA